jgi:ATP-dependent 26S proteasome regulatory subunit
MLIICLQIHAASIAKKGDIDWEAVVKLSEGFNGACSALLSCAHRLGPCHA